MDVLQTAPAFQTELNFFIEHQDDLVERYNGKALIIRGREVIGAFESPLAAYLEGLKSFPAGTFMIQTCQPGPAAYTVTISSMNL